MYVRERAGTFARVLCWGGSGDARATRVLVSVHVCARHATYINLGSDEQLILTWYRAHRDQDGGRPRRRLFHCTSVELMPAITPNVGNSGTQFIRAGVCVRARPFLQKSIYVSYLRKPAPA